MSPITLVAPDGPRPFLRRFMRLRDKLVGLLDERLDDAQPLTRAERTRLVGELVELERQVQQRRFYLGNGRRLADALVHARLVRARQTDKALDQLLEEVERRGMPTEEAPHDPGPTLADRVKLLEIHVGELRSRGSMR